MPTILEKLTTLVEAHRKGNSGPLLDELAAMRAVLKDREREWTTGGEGFKQLAEECEANELSISAGIHGDTQLRDAILASALADIATLLSLLVGPLQPGIGKISSEEIAKIQEAQILADIDRG